MAVLKIRTNPDPVLRKKARRVPNIDSSIHRIIDDMIETMHAASGVGLAANQVGIPLRIAVIQIPEQDVLVLINPEFVEKKGERLVIEGCLSIPGYQAEIQRSESVKVKARNKQGKLVRIKADDLLAQALEHEMDHLNGVLYIDYLEDKSQLKRTESDDQKTDY